MIEHYLPNKIESATVTQISKFRGLNTRLPDGEEVVLEARRQDRRCRCRQECRSVPAAGMVYGLYLCAVPVERHRLYESYDKHRPRHCMRLPIAIDRRKLRYNLLCACTDSVHHRRAHFIICQMKSHGWWQGL